LNKKKACESESLHIIQEPTEFFKQHVTKALKKQKLRADPNTEYYIVNMLTRFISSESLFSTEENGTKKEEVLALLMQKALTAEAERQKQENLRRLGDISLYTAGFFSEHLSRKIVDVDYYIDMGKTAYGNLAGRPGYDALLKKIFHDLALHFTRFVDVLAEISEDTGTANKGNILRLYEIWLKTRSEKAENGLKEAGVIPNFLLKPDWQ
jgi:hypothetical protein